MIKALMSDVSKVLLFPKDKDYVGSLNELYKNNTEKVGVNFFDYFELNTELLDYYKSLSHALDLYIFTSDVIQDDPALKKPLEIFKKIYSASKMELNKSDPNSYSFLLKDLGLHSRELIYIDDNQLNVRASLEVGIPTIRYENYNQSVQEIQQLIKTLALQ